MIRLLLLALLTFGAAPTAHADEPSVDFTPIEQVLKDELKADGVPGAVVVIVRDNAVVYAKGFGFAGIEEKNPVTPDHLFRIGSTTKMFVGMALVKLAEAGKLKLDEPVGKLIDGLPPAIAALTPHQLLTHTAGLADDAVMFGKHDDEALADGLKTWTDKRFFTKPGDVYSYSNPGYWLAGFVAEKAAGKPFADVVKDDLLAPLGMKRSTFRPTLAMTYPLAQGHELKAGQPAIVRPAADNAANLAVRLPVHQRQRPVAIHYHLSPRRQTRRHASARSINPEDGRHPIRSIRPARSLRLWRADRQQSRRRPCLPQRLADRLRQPHCHGAEAKARHRFVDEPLGGDPSQNRSEDPRAGVAVQVRGRSEIALSTQTDRPERPRRHVPEW